MMHTGIALPPVLRGKTGSSRLEVQLRCPDTSPSGELKPTSAESETKKTINQIKYFATCRETPKDNISSPQSPQASETKTEIDRKRRKQEYTETVNKNSCQERVGAPTNSYESEASASGPAALDEELLDPLLQETSASASSVAYATIPAGKQTLQR